MDGTGETGRAQPETAQASLALDALRGRLDALADDQILHRRHFQ
jgi:hypothetical protein